MARRSVSLVSASFLLQLCLGAFFVALGVMGMTDYNSKTSEILRWAGRNDTLKIVTSIVELVMGVLLVLGLFMRISSSLARILSIVLFCLWAFYMAVTFVVNNPFEPNFIVWLYNVSWNAVILVSLWVVGENASR